MSSVENRFDFDRQHDFRFRLLLVPTLRRRASASDTNIKPTKGIWSAGPDWGECLSHLHVPQRLRHLHRSRTGCSMSRRLQSGCSKERARITWTVLTVCRQGGGLGYISNWFNVVAAQRKQAGETLGREDRRWSKLGQTKEGNAQTERTELQLQQGTESGRWIESTAVYSEISWRKRVPGWSAGWRTSENPPDLSLMLKLSWSWSETSSAPQAELSPRFLLDFGCLQFWLSELCILASVRVCEGFALLADLPLPNWAERVLIKLRLICLFCQCVSVETGN